MFFEEIEQLSELFWSDVFRPDFFVDSQFTKYIFQEGVADVSHEKIVEQSFSAVPECGFKEPPEFGFIRQFKKRFFSPLELDQGRPDFGGW